MTGENTMEYISIITFFAGYLISEIIRRINRAESFNTQIFNKRLDVFSELYSTWNRAYMDVSTFIEAIINGEFSENDDLDGTHFILVSPLLKLLDEKALFFSQELCVHCGAALLCPDDYSEESCKAYLERIKKQNKIVTNMIRDESGLTMLNKNIKGIIKYKHKSDIITRFKEIQRDNKL